MKPRDLFLIAVAAAVGVLVERIISGVIEQHKQAKGYTL